MSKDKTKPADPQRKKLKYEKWGQWCLMLALILNGIILLIYNWRLSSLENEQAENRGYMQDFMNTHRNTEFEIAKQTSNYMSLRQIQMLRRLSKNLIPSDLNQTLEQDESDLTKEILRSSFNIISGIYLNGLDVPGGADPVKKFSGFSQDSMQKLSDSIYINREIERKDRLVAKAYQLSADISYWKPKYTSATILSTIFVLLGNIFWIIAGRQLKADLPKPA